ncbi:MAG TPA: replication-relaxation family protein [bacterium]|nr:replication-relaxation family protein [bacterium]
MRSWERAAPALACLTPRDRALLRVLRDLRYLTSPQAHRACYPGCSLTSVRARLGELRRRGLLARLRRDTFDDRRAFWGLAPVGRAAANALDGPHPVGPAGDTAAMPRAAAVAALQLDHLAATNEVFCDLCEAARTRRLSPIRWLAACRSIIDLDQTQLVPDAVVLIAAPAGGWWTYYLERDRGTMPLRAMREKFERYALLLRLAGAQSADSAWALRADAWLLLACDDERRAEYLAALAADSGLDRTWAGRADECAAGLAASLDGTAAPPDCPFLPAWAAGALVVPDPNLVAEREEDHR